MLKTEEEKKKNAEVFEVYPPKNDIAAEKRWRDRLSGLDEELQKQIASKYYGGHMPWKK